MEDASHRELYRQLILLLRNCEGWEYGRRHQTAEWFFRVNRLPLPENRFELDPAYCPGCPDPVTSLRTGQ